MNVLVIYCHPSSNSFTYKVKEKFLEGLRDAGHDVVLSDLYAMGFNPVMSEKEYLREAFYNDRKDIPGDIKAEQKKLLAADIITFIYPDFWTAEPAMLTGWFQRVWTYGFAYGDTSQMKIFDKALFMVTMGGSLKDEIRQVQIEAMKTVIIGDRMNNRARECNMIVFDEMTRGYNNENKRQQNESIFLKQSYEAGRNIARVDL